MSDTNHKAIGRVILIGLAWVNLPSMAITFGGYFAEFLIAKDLNLQPGFGAVGNLALIGLASILPFALGWLWWSLNVSKWQVWALTEIGDWLALEPHAVEAQLIGDTRTWLGRLSRSTEIWFAPDRRRFADLRRRGPN